MHTKKISVIIPCYNVEKYVDRCVRSLVGQSIGIDALELIFVDDASTDGTVSKLKRWEKRFPESVIIVVCAENGRQGTARNIGFSYASAEFIGYIDADDWVEAEMYETLYQHMIQSDVDVVSCLFGRDTGDGKLIDISNYCGPTYQKILIQSDQDREDFFKYGLPGSMNTKLFKKNFLIKNGLFFPEGLAYEDNYFGTILSFTVNSVYVVDKVFYHYFYNLESTVTTRNSMHQLDRLKIELMILKDLEERGQLEKHRMKIMNTFLHRYYVNTLHLIFTRFDNLPLEIIEEMKRTVLEKFPDWKSSDYYRTCVNIERVFLDTLGIDMTKEMWENLKNNYLHLCDTISL